MATVTFTKDYASRKKGDVWTNCPGMLASKLVHNYKVAKYGEVKAKKKTSKA